MGLKFNFKFLIAICLLSLLSCTAQNKKKLSTYDDNLKLSKKQIKESLTSPEVRNRHLPSNDLNNSTKLELSQILMAPTPPKMAAGKLISLSITEDVSVKDVLIEISRLANIEVQMDPNISGGIILVVRDRPLLEVVDKISNLANLRYTFEDNILHIQRDLPYVKSYSVNFLDLERTSSSSSEITTKAGSGDLKTGGETKIETTSEGDAWKTIISNIEDLLEISEQSQREQTKTSSDQDSLSEDSYRTKTTSKARNYISVNRQAGSITISTTEKKHKIIAKYLRETKRNVTAQVLIEAKLIEVALTDEFKTGINWDDVSSILGTGAKADFSGLATEASSTGGFAPFALGITDSNFSNNKPTFSSIFKILQTYGLSRTLQSPRINALNNQQAILSFTKNKVYFSLEYKESSTTAASTTGTNTVTADITSTKEIVPLGVILSLQPSINLQTKEILLNIKPTITQSDSSVNDPAVELTAAKIGITKDSGQPLITNEVPVVEVRELDTIMKLQDGQVMVLGGLIKHTNKKDEYGIPFLKDIPILGYLFKGSRKSDVYTETVILIKTTIVDSNSELDRSDKNFYKTFTTDPHPFTF